MIISRFVFGAALLTALTIPAFAANEVSTQSTTESSSQASSQASTEANTEAGMPVISAPPLPGEGKSSFEKLKIQSKLNQKIDIKDQKVDQRVDQKIDAKDQKINQKIQ